LVGWKYTQLSVQSAVMMRVRAFARMIPAKPSSIAVHVITEKLWKSEQRVVDKYGHTFHPEPHPDIPEGRVGWECKGCSLFVMTTGELPQDAETIYVSCGSFSPDLWKHWLHDVYIERANTQISNL
jgi:hypothetical protein